MIVTRFAPSPTGALHLGHAYSALFAFRAARAEGGLFRLRIEDIDQSRCRKEFEAAILVDLAWLGIAWDGPVHRQSDHMGRYADALQLLRERDLVYPCFCSRKDIASAASAPHGMPAHVYPGLCRDLPPALAAERIARGDAHAMRFNSAKAARRAGVLSFFDRARGRIAVQPEIGGDVVLGRRDAPASYHLAVVIDDAHQGVTLVTRGEDLFDASHVQRLIQAALGLPAPEYHHHRVLTNSHGQRLSKRDGALAISAMRADGRSPEDIRRNAGFPD